MTTTFTADQFRAACEAVQSGIVSLRSCRRNEIDNEGRILRLSVERLEGATLLRRSPRLQALRVAMLERSADALTRAFERSQHPEPARAA